MRYLLFAAALLLLPHAFTSIEPYRDPGPPPLLRTKAILMVVTAYDRDKACVGRWAKGGKTSTGKNAKILDGAAVDPRLVPYGKKLRIFGVKGEKIADDTGGRIRQDGEILLYHVDVRVASHKEARELFKGKGWDIRPVCVDCDPKKQ